MRKKYLITFSGGKDSLAIILWAKANLPFHCWEVVFCDTGWESPETYAYIDWIERMIGKTFIRLKTVRFADKVDQEVLDKIIEIFGGRNVFAEMVAYKGRFPSTRARFCTEELKMKVMIDYILTLSEDIVVVQGVRAEESEARRNLKENDEYFRFYFEPKKVDKRNQNVYDTYRKEDVIKWSNNFTCDVERPILWWTAAQVFEHIFMCGFKANPLYYKGHSRVGCYPCIMCRLEEVRLVAINDPKRIDQLSQLEAITDSTFFPPLYIPEKHCSKIANVRVYPEDLVRVVKGKKKKLKNAGSATLFDVPVVNGDAQAILYQQYFKNPNITVQLDDQGDEYIMRKMRVPTVRDVVAYVCADPNQANIYEASQGGARGCVSVYNICESAG